MARLSWFGRVFCAAACVSLTSVVSAAPILLGPTPYLELADSPFPGPAMDWFHVEDFEDAVLDAPGITLEGSAMYLATPGGNTDSVDADDGNIDGYGTAGHSWWGSGSIGIRVTFDDGVLGELPTHAGIVWTDGAGQIEFEAFDETGTSLGTLVGNHADGAITGTTGEDRFYGAVHSGGISAIFIRNTAGGIEIDHIQYGVPEPATFSLLALGGLALIRRRR